MNACFLNGSYVWNFSGDQLSQYSEKSHNHSFEPLSISARLLTTNVAPPESGGIDSSDETGSVSQKHKPIPSLVLYSGDLYKIIKSLF